MSSAFPVAFQARQKYHLDESMLTADGQAYLPDLAAARRWAAALNRDAGGATVSAAELYALGLLHEAARFLLRHALTQRPQTITRAFSFLETYLGPKLEEALRQFVEAFPPRAVAEGIIPAEAYLQGQTGDYPNRQAALEELFLLHLAQENPAAQPYRELFDLTPLKADGPCQSLLELATDFFAHLPGLSGTGVESESSNLVNLLTAPSRLAPHSLEAQLAFLIEKWGHLLGEAFLQRLQRGLDYVREAQTRRAAPGGHEIAIPSFHAETETERFSPDADWMTRLVLIARNTCVWLYQLSRKYGRAIQTLDQIPDEELELLQQRGLNGLWLIGLWQRSQASQRIKQMMGNPDAAASAYALVDYEIAAELGGWEAFHDLKQRATRYGIRLAADMVPNHMAIDSRWVIEHPDWFISLPYPPFPSYTFNGPDLSSDNRVGIFLEDHYYDRRDAAVVFKRLDRRSGEERYIYHGNDGTSLPWNDTAQLDYSKAEVREAVIQTILHVARHFPIIRFDAAMTLVKKHIQRLWFPAPGQGGAIPSRAEHSLTPEDFEARCPNEFWREVVDRVAAEAPDTLLLAEAFWLMEGYFVRTLGMHRVYNSAFMHMLRDENNAGYRQVMKNTLEFDPEVLKRFVNFMSNPDEETAAAQFGTTDKYFGVCTLMVTLPGLPMFAHGQIEGLREKYGMEYRRAYWEEAVDEALVHGHEQRIFPLLHRRPLFADVQHFLLYDFFVPEGTVNEDVFAYTNVISGSAGLERALILYHNRYRQTEGWVRTSVAFRNKASGQLTQKTLADGLRLPAQGYVVFKDYVSGLEYIRSCRELTEKGFFSRLGPYECHVFLDWRFVDGEDWAALCDSLQGAGVPSLQAQLEVRLQSLRYRSDHEPKTHLSSPVDTSPDRAADGL